MKEEQTDRFGNILPSKVYYEEMAERIKKCLDVNGSINIHIYKWGYPIGWGDRFVEYVEMYCESINTGEAIQGVFDGLKTISDLEGDISVKKALVRALMEKIDKNEYIIGLKYSSHYKRILITIISRNDKIDESLIPAEQTLDLIEKTLSNEKRGIIDF